MRKLNILFSTTRQFNIGDEAILFGILNLFDKLIGKENYNALIFNRNPDIRSLSRINIGWKTKKFTLKKIKGKSFLKIFFNMDFFDNSIKDDSNYKNIDLVVFAGTPEWYGMRLKPLYKQIVKNNIQTIYLGIGTGEKEIGKKLSNLEKVVLNKTKVIAVRDDLTYHLLSKYNCLKIACPALLSSLKQDRVVTRVKKIGLIYSSARVSTNNSISSKTEKYLFELYKRLIKLYDVEFICHYVDEIDEIEKDFFNMQYSYSYDARQYYNIYQKFDLVIGCRIHGIGIAASMNIPGVIVKHDYRGNTANEFCSLELDSQIKNLDGDLEKIQKLVFDIETKSKQILEKKKSVEQMYMNLLNNNASFLTENMK